MRHLKMTTLWLASIGLVLPHIGTVSAADRGSRTGADQVAGQTTIVDVALTHDNLLRGQLVDREGAPKAGAEMTLGTADRVVSQTATDERGLFALAASKGGLYNLSDGQTSVFVRAWTNRAAPPMAKPGILVVSDQTVARAALDGDHVVLRRVLIGLGIAGAIAIPLALDDAS